MSVLAEGRAGERWARRWLKDQGARVFQADWLAEFAPGVWVVVEVKSQEAFEPPPFFGHGLPPYQVRARLAFYEATGIPTLLLVRDLGSGAAYWQWLDVLDAGPKYVTDSADPRVIYPLTAFETDG